MNKRNRTFLSEDYNYFIDCRFSGLGKIGAYSVDIIFFGEDGGVGVTFAIDGYGRDDIEKLSEFVKDLEIANRDLKEKGKFIKTKIIEMEFGAFVYTIYSTDSYTGINFASTEPGGGSCGWRFSSYDPCVFDVFLKLFGTLNEYKNELEYRKKLNKEISSD
jgi:hypothetical protein